MRRFQGCQEITGDEICWSLLCQDILTHPGLRKITLHEAATYDDRGLSGFNGDLLTQVFAKMDEIEIHRLSCLWPQGPKVGPVEVAVTRCVVDSILSRPDNLKKLVLKNVVYKEPFFATHIDPVVSPRLATALNKVEVLDVELLAPEVNLLLKAMMENETSVTSLSLSGQLVLSHLEPDYLFGVFDKVKELWVVNDSSRFIPPRLDLVTTLCEKVAMGTGMRKLTLQGFHDLSLVDRSTLSTMVTKLEELTLHDFKRGPTFSRDDLVTIITAIATIETSNMKKIFLYIDLRSIDCSLLANMATKVEHLGLQCAMEEEQLRAIFEAVAAWPGKLKWLAVSGRSSLHRLDADILASAVSNLECFDCWEGFVTVNQAEKILRMALKSTTLRRLIFGVQDYTSNLDPLVKEAEAKIPHTHVEGYVAYSDSDSDSDSESDLDYEYESDLDQTSESDVD